MKKSTVFLLIIFFIGSLLGQAHNAKLNGSFGVNLLNAKFPTIDFAGTINENSKVLIGFNFSIKSYLKEISNNLFLVPSVSAVYYHSPREEVILTGLGKGGYGDPGYNDISAWSVGFNCDFIYIMKRETKNSYIGAGIGFHQIGMKTEVYDGLTTNYDNSGAKTMLNLIAGFQMNKNVDFEIRAEICKDVKVIKGNFNYILSR